MPMIPTVNAPHLVLFEILFSKVKNPPEPDLAGGAGGTSSPNSSLNAVLSSTSQSLVKRRVETVGSQQQRSAREYELLS